VRTLDEHLKGLRIYRIGCSGCVYRQSRIPFEGDGLSVPILRVLAQQSTLIDGPVNGFNATRFPSKHGLTQTVWSLEIGRGRPAVKHPASKGI